MSTHHRPRRRACKEQTVCLATNLGQNIHSILTRAQMTANWAVRLEEQILLGVKSMGTFAQVPKQPMNRSSPYRPILTSPKYLSDLAVREICRVFAKEEKTARTLDGCWASVSRVCSKEAWSGQVMTASSSAARVRACPTLAFDSGGVETTLPSRRRLAIETRLERF